MPLTPSMPPEPPALVRRVVAAPCDAAFRARLLASPDAGETEVSLTCSLRLAPGDRVLKRLVIEGAAASHLTLDCAGATLGMAGEPAHLGAYTIAIRSRPPAHPGGGWDRPSDITIRDCRVFGHVRIWGQGENG